MIESLPLTVAFTVLFAVTGAFHLRRCAALWSQPPAGGPGRAVELAHLLMSLAMIGMAWAWGGPGARWLQIGAFGLLTAYFLAQCVAMRAGASATAGAGQAGAATAGPATAGAATAGIAALGYHALAVGAMTWMVAAMPLLGHEVGASGTGHHGTVSAAAPAPGPPAAAAPWAVVVTLVLAAVLVVAAVAWVRPRSCRHDRAAGRCHALMGAGMAGMLLVMI